MNARFELVLDNRGKFHFQLRGHDDEVLLRGGSCATKAMAEIDVAHTREVMRDVKHLAPFRSYDGGHFLVIKYDDDKMLARSSRVPTARELALIAKQIRTIPTDVPLVDLSDRKEAHAR
jgi:uncharacterized protein YegP (UPF0339 family)